MSVVIEFPAKRIIQAIRDDTGAPADIIIFPGVIIERSELDVTERKTPSKPRSAR